MPYNTRVFTLAAGERFFSPERVEVRTEAGRSGWVTRRFMQLHSGGGGRAGADGAVVRSGRQLSSAHLFTLAAGERL